MHGAYVSVFNLEKRRQPISTENFRTVGLDHVSIDSENPYCGGTIPFDVDLRIVGSPNDTVENMTLFILQNGQRQASARLVRNHLTEPFFQPFGQDLSAAKGAYDGQSSSGCLGLFELDQNGARQISATTSKTVAFELEVKTKLGQSITVAHSRSLILLNRFKGGNTSRFGIRDYWYGGDDWAQPHVLGIISRMFGIPIHLRSDLRFNDFSSLHGASFEPDHRAHRKGLETDGLVPGFPSTSDAKNGEGPGEIAADNMIKLFSQMDVQDLNRIEKVLVTYKIGEPDAFRERLEYWTQLGIRIGQRFPKQFFVTDILKLKRLEEKKNKKFPGHRDHFHIIFRPVPGLVE